MEIIGRLDCKRETTEILLDDCMQARANPNPNPNPNPNNSPNPNPNGYSAWTSCR